ncbi:MAG: penicillin-binding protein 1A [Gammaproteobacteria bacterium]|nr:penicillin-binding protein 1A [Gammaproteobacteria bacterium]
MKYFFKKTLKIGFYLFLMLAAAGGGTAVYVLEYVLPELPSTENLKARMQIPLRVYTRDNVPIAEFGKERRIPISIERAPPMLIKAILAAEDDRFYSHSGVDLKGMVRVLFELLRTGRITQGASTITMQVARNFFLTRERTFKRKFKEILLAWRIENELTKDEIIELYVNKIFLGHRAYGVGAAAQVYYGTDIQNLTLAQFAMVAGLPKAPSANNPLSNPKRALARRNNYVLPRMLKLHYITQAEYREAVEAPITAKLHRFALEMDAPYIAEMARAYVEENYTEDVYGAGFKVFTSLDSRLQKAAQKALRNALYTYDMRHGYRGPVEQASLPSGEESETAKPQLLQEQWDRILKKHKNRANLMPALVLEVNKKSAVVYSRGPGRLELAWEELAWARRYITDERRGRQPKTAEAILAPGDIIYIREKELSKKEKQKRQQAGHGKHWQLSQTPLAEGAFVALDQKSGAILALMGGFDFYQSKFNRVTQAQRQPGSNFKPFIYSAALEHGFTPASIVNDSPMVFETNKKNEQWIPDAYSGKFLGFVPLRTALAKSLNLVSIRLVHAITIQTTLDYVARFGFAFDPKNPDRVPRNFTLALGTASLTPLEVVSGFAVLANGGYRIEPYFIEHIEDYKGQVIYQAKPRRVCRKCKVAIQTNWKNDKPGDGEEPPPQADAVDAPRHAPRVITPQNAWLMTSMLQSVIREGTGRAALSLGRSDLAGKTGTTNEQRDAWFSGYNADVVATAWVGFDQPRPLGDRETGGRVALPMWMDFMREALANRPSRTQPRPPGLTTVRIDPDSGLLAKPGDADAVLETFRVENVPDRYAPKEPRMFTVGETDEQQPPVIPDQIF